jgi:hypothetical protein
MDCGINTLKDLLEASAYAFTIAGFIFIYIAVRSYRRSVKTLNFEIITSCNSRFYGIVDDLYESKPDPKILRQFIDLCNEEIFYFKNDYLKDDDIISEWIDGMLDFLPVILNGTCINSNQSHVIEVIINDNMLENYSRLKKYITLENKSISHFTPDNLKDLEKRKVMVSLLIKNIQNNK